MLLGIGLGVAFGVNEDRFEAYVAQGIAANPYVHDSKSQEKIERYAQGAHFHTTGIAAFSLGLLLVVVAPSLTERFKKIAGACIGLGGFYPLAWLAIFLLAPSVGRAAAHAHPLTEICSYIGVGGLLLCVAILPANLFLGVYSEPAEFRTAP